MGIRKFFGGTDDPIAVYRRELLDAVKSGDQEQLQVLLQDKIDAPPSVVNDALKKAVDLDRLKMTDILLKAPGQRTLDHGNLRQVVYDGRDAMFRLLSDAGFGFANSVPDGEGAGSYMSRLGGMQKDLTIAKLREEVAELKTALSELKKPKDPALETAEPGKKDLPKLDL